MVISVIQTFRESNFLPALFRESCLRMVQKSPDMPFAQNSQLSQFFIALKPLVSAIALKSNANFKFNFSHRGKNSMLDP
jgi:hypothetical protein